jgi:hypothetical protein
MLVHKSTIKAPTEVIKAETPSQASLPKLPALPKVAIEMKKRSDPMRTLGWLSGILILESKKANEKKTNGKKIVAQENAWVRASFNFIKMSPLLAKETITRAASAKKKI